MTGFISHSFLNRVAIMCVVVANTRAEVSTQVFASEAQWMLGGDSQTDRAIPATYLLKRPLRPLSFSIRFIVSVAFSLSSFVGRRLSSMARL